MDGGLGDDVMRGEAGNDTYYVNSLGDQVIESPGGGVDTVWTTLAALTLAIEVENLRYNGGGAFWGIGNGLDNTVAGGWGADRLEGGGGDDVLIGSLGADALIGGAGVDTASYAGAFEGVDARLASGGYAGEALGDSYAGVENLIGSDFDDVLFGDAGANVLSGRDGSDWLRGEGGADVLRGGAGFDALDGGLGDDRFDFDRVTDSLPGARDVIQGFEGAGVAGGDVIDLSGIDADAGAGGNQAFTFGGVGRGQVSVIELGGNTLVRANVDGDAAFEFELLIEDGDVPASAYGAGDFVL
jgi:serralysin